MPTPALLTYLRARRVDPDLPAEERLALARIRTEAREQGAGLHSGGEGGLPPSLVLGVFRRDQWRCKRCGGAGDLSIHHKGGVFASKWLRSKGHAPTLNNLVTLCTRCHDTVHDDARAQGLDSSQHREEP